MLSKKEEQKVVTFLEDIAKFSNLDAQMAYWMTAREFQWLATRVIELNEELKKVQAEIDRNNEIRDYTREHMQEGDKVVKEVILKPEQEQSDTLRNLYSPKNEISDRFYPR